MVVAAFEQHQHTGATQTADDFVGVQTFAHHGGEGGQHILAGEQPDITLHGGELVRFDDREIAHAGAHRRRQMLVYRAEHGHAIEQTGRGITAHRVRQILLELAGFLFARGNDQLHTRVTVVLAHRQYQVHLPMAAIGEADFSGQGMVAPATLQAG